MANVVFPWIGGKSRLVRQILPVFPVHSCYVEAFAGGAAVFFAKDRAKAEVLNDLNGDIVNLYRVLQHHLDEFVRQFRWAIASRQLFDWAKETKPGPLTDIQRAARFWFLQKLSFGGKVTGQTFGTATTSAARINLTRVEEDLSAAHLRLSGVVVEHLAWHECVRRYDRPHTLFFLDPPYWQTEGYGVDFAWREYEALADWMAKLDGKAVLTINDHPDVRALFKGFKTERVGINYTCGGGAKAKAASELIIRSWR